MSEPLAILTDPTTIAFIAENLDADTHKLLLNPPAEFKNDIQLIVDQIVSRRKAKTKVPDWYANGQLILPPPLSMEQCSSPATAHYKKQLLRGSNLIDLTGGTGIDTLALAENYSSTTFVERDPWLCEVFAHNANVLFKNTIQVLNKTAEEFLQSFDGKADFFIDPARRDDHQKKVFHFENCSPNLIELLPVLQQKAERVLVKAAPMIDISLGIRQLRYVQEVHVVSLKNEVKEVLFLLDFAAVTDDPPIICVNLESDHPAFRFTTSDEKAAVASLGTIAKYLYDPNASVLKAGAFKSVAQQYQLIKLATNTHLYTSEEQITDFPGRIFEVLQADCSRKDIQKLLPDGKANVITKNHPLKADELKKKLKLKDGGDHFVIGYRDEKGKARLVLSKIL